MQDYVDQRDGVYYIAGTRLALDSIVLAFKNGGSPETILQSFPMAPSGSRLQSHYFRLVREICGWFRQESPPQ